MLNIPVIQVLNFSKCQIKLIFFCIEIVSNSSSKDLANLQTQLQEKEAECLALSGQLDQLQTNQAETFKLQAKLRDIEYILKGKEEALIDLQNQLESLQQSSQLAASSNTVKVSSLGSTSPKKSKRGKSRQQEDPTARLALVEEQLAVVESEKRTLQQRVELLLSELDSDRNQSNDMANIQSILSAKEAECCQLAAEKEELRQQLDGAERQLFDLRAKNRDVEYKLEGREESVRQLEQDKSNNSTSLSRLQETLRQVREELGTAEVELSQRAETIQRLEKSCSSLTKESQEKALQVVQLREDLSEAEMVLGEQDAKLKAVQDELNRMKQLNDAEDDGRSTLEAQMDHAQMERVMLQQDLTARCAQLDECREAGNRLEEQLESSRVKESQLQSQIEALISERTASEEKFTALTEKYKKLAGNYKQVCSFYI